MRRRSNHIKLTLFISVSMCSFAAQLQAQSIIFSPDQWPKRWERAMQNNSMKGHLVPAKMQSNNVKKVSYQGWGQQPEQGRRKRSKTPEYNHDNYKRYDNNSINRRYAAPQTLPNAYGYRPYPATGYYRFSNPAYPVTYPGMYPGIGMPGFGMPGSGLPYSSPFLMAPGVFPGRGYPW